MFVVECLFIFILIQIIHKSNIKDELAQTQLIVSVFSRRVASSVCTLHKYLKEKEDLWGKMSKVTAQKYWLYLLTVSDTLDNYYKSASCAY